MKKLILILTLIFLFVGNANAVKTTEQIKCEEKYLYKYEDVKFIKYCKNIGIYLDLHVSIDELRKELKK
jgi:hypothetical protein|tara:strand:+ start:211 stop:417 length:207 start_codon:yes stop_codon:yes gene_type:complete